MAEQGFLRVVAPRAARPRRRGKIAGVFVALALAGGAVRYLSGPAFDVRRFDIEGTRRVRTRDVVAVLAAAQGRNLVTLRLSPLVASLEKLPWVARVSLAKQLPDTLGVTIAEKAPVALRRLDGRLYWLEGGGAVIAPFDPRDAGDVLPVITAPDAELPGAVALLSSLTQSVPGYAAALSEIWALPGGGFGMMDTIFRVPIEVLPADAPEKIRALLALRTELSSRGLSPRSIDLRFDRRIVLAEAFGEGRSI